jgi:methyl-accepting chemotaxis protein
MMRRLEHKIIFVLLFVLIVTFGGILFLVSTKIQSYFVDQERQKAALLALTIHQALDKDMLAFRADNVRRLILGLQDLEGVARLQIIRAKDGKGTEAAFMDFKTLDDVKTRIPIRSEWVTDHVNQPVNVAEGTEYPAFREAFQRILKNPYKAKDEYYIEQIKGKSVLTYLRPLPNFQQCYLCHGSDHELRGILMVSTNLENMKGEISADRKQLFWLALGTLLLIGGILKVSMHKVVMSPMHQVVERIQDIADGEGDLTKTILVQSNDEVGQVASGFNRFVEKLRIIVVQVLGTARQVTQAVHEVLKNTHLIAQGSEIQAGAIDSTLKAVSHLNGSVQQVNDRVTGLSALSEESTAAVMEISASIQEIASETDTLSKTVEGVSSAIIELSSSTHLINENVEILSVSADETTASSLQMDRIIDQIRTHVHSSVELSNRVAMNAKQGEGSVDQALDGIQRIKQYSEQIYAVIHRLQKRTEDIGKILDVIAEVAEQTNLLALNASIIAAQSGEQGKGFAVVAREIKELAERTSTSTQEIHEIVIALQKEGSSAVKVIEEGAQHVADGVHRSQGVREALGKIIESSSVSAQQISEIAKATDEQAKGVQKVADAMQRVNEMIKQIAKTTAEQKNSSKLVIENTENARLISQRVRSATQEQTKGNQQIQRLVEDLNHRIKEIVDVSQNQKGECGEILKAVEQVRLVTVQNMDAVGRVGYAVENLMKQSSSLENEISKFKLQRDTDERYLPKLPEKG